MNSLIIKELIWQIVNGVDIQKSKDIPLYARSPFIECRGLYVEHLIEAQQKHLDEHGNDKMKMSFQVQLNSVEYADNAPRSGSTVYKALKKID